MKANFICPRCGEEHKDIEAKPLLKFSKPHPDVQFGNWLMCPITNEPVLLGLNGAQRKAQNEEAWAKFLETFELSLAS